MNKKNSPTCPNNTVQTLQFKSLTLPSQISMRYAASVSVPMKSELKLFELIGKVHKPVRQKYSSGGS